MTDVGNASHDDVRRYNLGRILRYVHAHGPTSRSLLGTEMRLNRSTVADLVASLAALGLVVEESGSGGAVGRPSLVVSPVPEAACVLAFRLGVTDLAGAIVGLGGRVLAERVVDGEIWTPESAIATMAGLARDLVDDLDGGVVIVGVGVSVPGAVDPDHRTIHRAPNLGWSNVSLAADLRIGLDEALGWMPDVLLGNDANLGALAERLRGAAVGAHDLLYVHGSVGIGTGVIVDGRLLTGASGDAGEAGHMIVDPDGPLCTCGAQGCWETIVGRDALLTAAGRDSGVDAFDLLMADAAAGDEGALRVVADAGRWIRIGLRNLVALTNPEVVVVAGHVDRLLAALPPETTGLWSTVGVVPSVLGEAGPLIGAAELAFTELLSDPTGAGRVLDDED